MIAPTPPEVVAMLRQVSPVQWIGFYVSELLALILFGTLFIWRQLRKFGLTWRALPGILKAAPPAAPPAVWWPPELVAGRDYRDDTGQHREGGAA